MRIRAFGDCGRYTSTGRRDSSRLSLSLCGQGMGKTGARVSHVSAPSSHQQISPCPSVPRLDKSYTAKVSGASNSNDPAYLDGKPSALRLTRSSVCRKNSITCCRNSTTGKSSSMSHRVMTVVTALGNARTGAGVPIMPREGFRVRGSGQASMQASTHGSNCMS